jgi:hypothetical protein
VRHLYNALLKSRGIAPKALFEAFHAGEESLRLQSSETMPTARTLFNNKSANDLTLTEEQHQTFVELSQSAWGDFIFVTKENHVGSSYHPDPINGIRPGDVVVGLFGINLPFVLQPASDGENYEMINVAYIGKHSYSNPALVGLPEETTEKDIWDNLEAFGLEEYTIV